MCVPYNSKPPIPPVAGAAVDTQDITLKSADGTEFSAFSAKAGNAGGPAVIVMPDVRGLFPFYEELAMRFAEHGYDSVAIDYFGRTAGLGKRGEDFPFMDHVSQTVPSQTTDDVRAALSWLREGEGNAERPAFTIGFCFGGTNSWLQGIADHGLAGVIGFYGIPTRGGRDTAPMIERVSELKCPLLAIMGEADQATSVEDAEKFRVALSGVSEAHDLHIYPGAPHSFFDRLYEEHAGASADAWDQVLGFIRRNS